jgi:hypothetical protein
MGSWHPSESVSKPLAPHWFGAPFLLFVTQTELQGLRASSPGEIIVNSPGTSLGLPPSFRDHPMDRAAAITHRRSGSNEQLLP